MNALLTSLLFILSTLHCAQKSKNNMSPNTATQQLLTAIKNNDELSTRSAIREHADLEWKDHENRTPLMVALYNNQRSLAKILIQNGANVNAQDKMLNTPFLYAGASGFTEIVELAMQNGANYSIYNRYNGTALIPACERGHVETVAQILKDKNFPIDHVNRLGWTALLEAVILGNGTEKYRQIVEMLINAGANLNIPDFDGVTTIQHARQKKQFDIVKLLEKAGAK